MFRTCWPSKAISIRTRSFVLIVHQLCQDPARRVRVNERDLQSAEAAAGLLVDQLRPAGGQPRELGGAVVDLEGDVVHARAALRDELPDRRLRTERTEQLDVRVADAEERDFDALVADLG